MIYLPSRFYVPIEMKKVKYSLNFESYKIFKISRNSNDCNRFLKNSCLYLTLELFTTEV